MTVRNISVYKLNTQHNSRTRLQVYFSSPCSILLLRKPCRQWDDTSGFLKWYCIQMKQSERDLAFSGFHELPPHWSTGSYSASITRCKGWEPELEKQLFRKISLILYRYHSNLPQNQSRTVCIVYFRNDCKQTSSSFCLSISLISSGESDMEPRKICGLQVEIEFAVRFLSRKFSHWWRWRFFFSRI
jgi:hypothetical protein